MSKLKAVIIEDETIIQLFLRMVLEKNGVEVVGIAETGREGVDIVLRERPDLVLMDIFLHDDMTGIDAAKKIFAVFDARIVYLTANSDSQTAEEALRTNPFGYLQKPVSEKDMKDLILKISESIG